MRDEKVKPFALVAMAYVYEHSGNIAVAIAGILALFVTQMFFVFFLGALSAGIQAIR